MATVYFEEVDADEEAETEHEGAPSPPAAARARHRTRGLASTAANSACVPLTGVRAAPADFVGEEVEHLVPVEMPVHMLMAGCSTTDSATPTVHVVPASSDAAQATAVSACSATQSAVEEARLRGNAAFARKAFDEAISAYTDAILLDEDNATLFGNRSAALLALGRKVGSVPGPMLSF